jgi:flagellar biosynthesis/type III secretory pathway M-ring protein FliF/YscJ
MDERHVSEWEVQPVLQTPYDVLMILWGVIFIALWIGFIAVMNHLFQNEEHLTEQLDRDGELTPGPQPHHPLHPAA